MDAREQARRARLGVIQSLLDRGSEAHADMALPAVRRLTTQNIERLLMDVLGQDLAAADAGAKLLVAAARAQATKKLYEDLLLDTLRQRTAEEELRKTETQGGNA